MSLISWIFGSSKSASVAETVGNTLDELFTSDEELLDKQALLQRLQQKPALAQADINKMEAAHRSIFVAGWRPFIGWVCGLGLANNFLINPWIQWITGQSGPKLPEQVMIDLVIALLGLGTIRTYEKIKGVSK